MTDTPPNPEQVYASLGQLARWLHRDVVRVQVVIEHGKSSRTVVECPVLDPTIESLSEHTRRILEFLKRFTDDNYVKRSAVAAGAFEGELDSEGTPFKEALQELTKAGLIDSKTGPGGGIRERR